MKKQYDGMKVEKVEFNYEENVVASGNTSNNWGCGHFEGDLEWANEFVKCNPCKWVQDGVPQK